jgi:pantoate--beta-alanine ligase
VLIVKTVDELNRVRASYSGSLGFIPTMGALHKGHISLIKESLVNNKHTFVSIFVNPTQFLEGEDLDKYPKTIEADIKLCQVLNVDVLFMPSKDDIYFDNEIKIQAPFIKSYILEGYNRPAHFDGVLQVVLKLFNIVKPSKAYFGKKDAQQLFLISNMVKKLFLPIEIIPKDIIRDDDGLALSSRNIYLTPQQRNQALAIPKSLLKASNLISNGLVDSIKIKNSIKETLKDIDIIEYIEVVDREFNRIKEIDVKNSIILIAVRVGNTRLIDNIWI